MSKEQSMKAIEDALGNPVEEAREAGTWVKLASSSQLIKAHDYLRTVDKRPEGSSRPMIRGTR